MNEKPEGTPNPLNPNLGSTSGSSETLDANPSEPISRARNMRSVDGLVIGNHTPVQEVVEETDVVVESAQPAQTASEVVAPQPVPTAQPVQPIDPMDRPMQQAPEPVAKPKKNKTGLIIAILLCLLVAVGCGVAAVLLMMNGGHSDPVAEAMNKLMSGGVPTNVAVSGEISAVNDDTTSPIAKIKIDLDAKLIANSPINSIDAAVTLTPRQGEQDLTFDVSEIYAESGDIYLKLDGLADALTGLMNLGLAEQSEEQSAEQSAEQSEDEMTPAPFFSMITDTIELVEGDWIRLSSSELESISESFMDEGPMSCMVNLVGDINTNSNSAAVLYKNNPFVISSTENMTVISRRDPIYKLSIDSDKFANYIESMQNTKLLEDAYSCFGWEGNVGISTEDVATVVSKLPNIYVEINSENNFTRLYLQYDQSTVDLTFSYPANINISEPIEYRDITEILQEVWGSN